MKYITLILITIGCLSVDDIQAQKSSKYDTLTLKVEGVCGMCEKRIETAAYDVKGVKQAKWDLDSEVLQTIVKHGKVTREEIAEALAQAGHTNELIKAVPEAYQKLPECCRYADGVKKHRSPNR